jgi:hypothetical protein
MKHDDHRENKLEFGTKHLSAAFVSFNEMMTIEYKNPVLIFFLLLLHVGIYHTDALAIKGPSTSSLRGETSNAPVFAPDESWPTSTTRRNALLSAVGMATLWAGLPPPSHAGLFEEVPQRQLELCIVSLLRIQFWAEKAVKDLQKESPETRKQRYLEVRLASKALVTGKLGGGANYQVYTLNSLQLKGVLADLAIYAQEKGGKSERRKLEDLSTDLIEALASAVEFDGLETTLDPSPRSSLTMTMYNNDKAVFVKRLLSEKVIPIIKTLIRYFGSDVEKRCLEYVQRTYPTELPMEEKPAEVLEV